MQLAPCIRAAINIATTSKVHGLRIKIVPYQTVKRPALKVILHHTEVKTVKKVVPASVNRTTIKFTLHLKSVKNVTRYHPAEEVRVKVDQ